MSALGFSISAPPHILILNHLMNFSSSHKFLCLLLFFCKCACAEINIDVLCLSSFDGKKSINMEMRHYFDRNANWTAGFVKYRNSKKPISIYLKSREYEILSESAPYQYTNTWLEIVNGKITGEYVITTQGAQVPSATYVNYSSKRTVYFSLSYDVEGSPSSGCKWE